MAGAVSGVTFSARSPSGTNRIRLWVCAVAAPADSANASMAAAMVRNFMVSLPGNLLARMLTWNASLRDAAPVLVMPGTSPAMTDTRRGATKQPDG